MIAVKSARKFSASVRIWFACDGCDLKGNATIGTGIYRRDTFVRDLNDAHSQVCPSVVVA